MRLRRGWRGRLIALCRPAVASIVAACTARAAARRRITIAPALDICGCCVTICAPTHSRIVTVDGQRRRGHRTLRGLASSEQLVEFCLACGERVGRAPPVTEKERATRYDCASEIVRAIDRAETGADDGSEERGHGSDEVCRCDEPAAGRGWLFTAAVVGWLFSK
jgi:hypothetical protein